MASYVECLEDVLLEDLGIRELSSHDVGGVVGSNEGSPLGFEDVSSELGDSPLSSEPSEGLISEPHDNPWLVDFQRFDKVGSTVSYCLLFIKGVGYFIIRGSAVNDIANEKVFSSERLVSLWISSSREHTVEKLSGTSLEREAT